jgi:hypothetical protein
MYGDALVAADTFDFLIDDPGTRLFCPPNAPIPRAEYSIALHVSTLIRDGGTLQLGIGELGDAIVYALQLRHQQPAIYRDVVESFGLLRQHRRLIETEGGTAPFERGLYGCSEMLADGFLDLYRSGVLKRRVYGSAKLQRLLDDGHIDEQQVSERTLAALHEGGMRRMSFVDFHEFRDVGLFRDDVEYDRGMLIAPDGTQLRANFDDPEQRGRSPRPAWASGCATASSPTPASSSARRASMKLCAPCRSPSAGCSRCARSASSTSCTVTSGN